MQTQAVIIINYLITGVSWSACQYFLDLCKQDSGESKQAYLLYRETSDPSGTAHNEQNNKPWTATLVPGYQISAIILRGSKSLDILCMGHAGTTH